MIGGRFPAVIGTLSVTVFVTVVAGIALWIPASFAVSKSEHLLISLGLLGHSWKSSHQFIIGAITGVLWTPIIAILAICVFRHAAAAERNFEKGSED